MERLKVLHLLATGSIGGIETLLKNYDEQSNHENLYLFVWEGGVIADALKESGRKVMVLNKTNLQTLSVFRTILKLCKEEKIQVAVVHHASPMLKMLLAVLKIFMPELPTIAYAHADAHVICNENKPFGYQVRKLIQKVGFRAADGVIAISHSVRKSLLNYLKVDPKKISIIYNGVPLKKYEEQVPKRKNGKFCFTYVGRLSKEKGVHNILQMFAALSPQVLDRIELQIIGDGQDKEKLMAMAQDKGLGSKTRFLGSRTDIPELLAESQFFVHFPACEEGFGLAIVEAMASGNICICLNKGAISEIINDGKDGYLLEDLSRETFESLILRLMDDYDTPEVGKLRKNSVERAKIFSLERFSEQFDKYIVDIYQKKKSEISK